LAHRGNGGLESILTALSSECFLDRGVHPKIVQEMLGHSSISITLDTYSHVLPNMQGAAADAMDDLF
jgi:integrase